MWNDQNEMMPDFGGLGIPFGSVYDEGSTTQKVPVGQRVVMKDGRVFRYAKAGGTIGVGLIAAAVPNEQAIAATYFGATAAVAPVSGEGLTVGDTKVRLTDDVTGVTANEYAGGFLTLTDAAGEGYQYRIKGNEASASGGVGFLVTLFDGDGIRVALSNASVGSMVADPLNAVIIAAAANPTVVVPMGRAMVGVAIGEFFWIQTWGVCSLKADTSTVDVGEQVILSEATAGSVQTGLGENVPVVGHALTDAADTIWAVCSLTINP